MNPASIPEQYLRTLSDKGFLRWDKTLIASGTSGIEFEKIFVKYNNIQSVLEGQSSNYYATFTAATSDTCTTTTSNIADGETVYIRSTGMTPSPLTPYTLYYLRDVSGNTFKLALTAGGAAINITSVGTGIHYLQFV